MLVFESGVSKILFVLVFLWLTTDCVSRRKVHFSNSVANGESMNKHKTRAYFFFAVAAAGLVTAWYFNAIGCHGGRVVFALESGPLDRMFARFIGLGKVEERRPRLSDIASIGKLFTDSNPI